jgi:acetyltransferase-like isoleucine patch superfamily enzyme
MVFDILKIIKNNFFIKRIYMQQKHNRVLPFGDYISDRWEKAKFLGFGDGTSVYDNVLILGNVCVGKNTWIGPNVVLDGSGGLIIGSHCSISAGVQIYTHDSVQWAITGGQTGYVHAETVVEDNCYIGPNVIIQKGVTIGSGSIIGANSLVTKNIPSNSKAYGTPAIVKGSTLEN